jgi:hypothetical protein
MTKCHNFDMCTRKHLGPLRQAVHQIKKRSMVLKISLARARSGCGAVHTARDDVMVAFVSQFLVNDARGASNI